jgi:hypothetical protein
LFVDIDLPEKRAAIFVKGPNYFGADAKQIVQVGCKGCSQVKSNEKRKASWKPVCGRGFRTVRIPCDSFTSIKQFLH